MTHECLFPREHEGHVAVDVLALQLAAGECAFEGSSQFDQDACPIHMEPFLELEEVFGLGDRALHIEGVLGVNLGRDEP